jgi:hypothetical protein
MAQGYAPELEGQKQPARALVERIAGELRRVGFTAQTEVLIGDVTRPFSTELPNGVPIS